MPMVGGTSSPKSSDPEVVEIVTSVKPQIEEHLGKPLDTIDVHSYKTQVVAGLNYFVKLRTGEDEFAHVRIYKHFKGDTSVHSLQKEKKEHEEIAYF
ncbi:UNVERIFIED_CONTAM: hypothetical protein RMT77_013078 [Armadillidium vulgare]